MTPQERTLRLYGRPSDHPGLDWAWVDGQLRRAMTYWVITADPGTATDLRSTTDLGSTADVGSSSPGGPSQHPQARPVWGVWLERRIVLSIGSPTLRHSIDRDPAVTVHLTSGTDVVIVEALALPDVTTTPEMVAAYDEKYHWNYSVGEYGELTALSPTKILAWQAAGTAGRDGFHATGCWLFDD